MLKTREELSVVKAMPAFDPVVNRFDIQPFSLEMKSPKLKMNSLGIIIISTVCMSHCRWSFTACQRLLDLLKARYVHCLQSEITSSVFPTARFVPKLGESPHFDESFKTPRWPFSIYTVNILSQTQGSRPLRVSAHFH